MSMTENGGAKIFKCLEEQKSEYNQLLHLVSKQKEAIAAGDDTLLMSIVQDKNKCLATIRKSETRMEGVLQGMSAQDVQHLRIRGETLRDEVVALIETLINAESECTESLEAKKIDAHGELKDLKSRKQSIKQYGAYKSSKGTGFSRDA